MKNELMFSDKLPRCRSTRKGTEVFIIEDNVKVSVYDDYSQYLKPSAKKWHVSVYNRTTGHKYDRICTSGGFYPRREQALAEIERFRYRGDRLIFYVSPIRFTYDIIGTVWGNAHQYYENEFLPATLEEQNEEARKRLFVITGKKFKRNIDLLNKYKGTIFEQVIQSFYEYNKSMEFNYFPYALLSDSTVLYVGGNKATWEYERKYIISKSEIYDGIMPAFVYNFEHPNFSEFGDVGYKYYHFKLYRTA